MQSYNEIFCHQSMKHINMALVELRLNSVMELQGQLAG